MKIFFAIVLLSLQFINTGFASSAKTLKDSVKVDRDFTLSASMLGYFNSDGARNPILRVQKGQIVRINIVNAEQMTHDITMENLGVKSEAIFEKGAKTSIVFKALKDDTYYCSIPGHRAAGMVGKFQVVDGLLEQEVADGIKPLKYNKPLNLDFENGDLSDWTATGDAFVVYNPGIKGTSLFDSTIKIGQTGSYFLTSGGTKNASKTGTLQSTDFTVTAPFAAFRISGGALHDTRVELVNVKTNEVIFQITGNGRATLLPVVVDLTKYLNQNIFIRIIDKETGITSIPYVRPDIWAHINFDNFRFYNSRPSFTNELKPEDIIVMPPTDPVLNSGLSGLDAAKAMTLPEGFKIQLAASEPDIIRPISFTIDPKGRLWVVEAHTYPTPAPEGQGKDRILILEDTDGDGTLDKRTVFIENLNMAAGIEIGMGGVWLNAAPYLLFIPVDFKTDKPLGPPQKLLDGWGLNDTHEIANNIRWGPDGWLYGAHGVFTHSNVGKPGASDAERIKINAGVWRFHPTSQKFEVFAEGTSNPWGIDFNQYGHPFVTVCVIPHMYHVIQGARFQRQAGKHFNPFTFDDIKTIADHVHYVGDRGPHAGNFRSASAGGGHAHAGAMIYAGGNNWPAQYSGEIFMNNINGAKVNIDKLNRSGSGYTATHQPDFITINDSWSQWLNFKYDQNGSVYVIDWYDKNQCHSPNADVHDKTLGRIFKISFKGDGFKKVDLTKASATELVNYQLNENEWYVRQARQILQERGPNKKTHRALIKLLDNNADPIMKLRAMWALAVTKGLNESKLQELLSDQSEYIRSWAIQFLAEDKMVSAKTISLFEKLAQNDASPLVRLYLSSAMLRLETSVSWNVVSALLKKSEDTSDHNLPLMYWYCLEPLFDIDTKRATQMALNSEIPNVLKFSAQKLGAIGNQDSKDALNIIKNSVSAKPHSEQNHEILQLIEDLQK